MREIEILNGHKMLVTDTEWKILNNWDRYRNVYELADSIDVHHGQIVSRIAALERKGIMFKNVEINIKLDTGVTLGSKDEPYYENESEVFRSLLPKYKYDEKLKKERYGFNKSAADRKYQR